jgi:hypothetical protein
MTTKIPEKYNTLMTKASGFSPLKKLVERMWVQAQSELEFQAILKKKTNDFSQYSIADIDLLKDEIFVSRENFRNFWDTLNDLIKEQLSYKPELKYGQLLSQKNGLTYNFVYEYHCIFEIKLNSPAYIFKIFEKGREDESCFSFQLREMENGRDLKVVDLYPDLSKYYLGKGISIAIILEARNIFKKAIISSSNLSTSHYCEWNTPEAIEKVWKKLVITGEAKYNRELDCYIVE